MHILVNGATVTHRRFLDESRFGYLVTAKSGRVHEITKTGKVWGVDNEAFGGWTREKELSFSKLLGRLCEHRPHQELKFVACPDVVADCKATRERFDRWQPIISSCNLPVAYVFQDGESDVPWDRIDCLFIGGSTAWKMSKETEDAILEGKKLGKWVHIGRVNSRKRTQKFWMLGADSIDGTAFSRWPDKYFPLGVAWLKEFESQTLLH